MPTTASRWDECDDERPRERVVAWPVGLSLTALAAFVAGMIAARGSFDDPRPWHNAWTQLAGVGATLAILLAALTTLRGRLLMRLQIGVLISLLLHFSLGLYLNTRYLELLNAPLEESPSDIAADVPERWMLPDYQFDATGEVVSNEPLTEPVATEPAELPTEIAPLASVRHEPALPELEAPAEESSSPLARVPDVAVASPVAEESLAAPTPAEMAREVVDPEAPAPANVEIPQPQSSPDEPTASPVAGAIEKRQQEMTIDVATPARVDELNLPAALPTGVADGALTEEASREPDATQGVADLPRADVTPSELYAPIPIEPAIAPGEAGDRDATARPGDVTAGPRREIPRDVEGPTVLSVAPPLAAPETTSRPPRADIAVRDSRPSGLEEPSGRPAPPVDLPRREAAESSALEIGPLPVDVPPVAATPSESSKPTLPPSGGRGATASAPDLLPTLPGPAAPLPPETEVRPPAVELATSIAREAASAIDRLASSESSAARLERELAIPTIDGRIAEPAPAFRGRRPHSREQSARARGGSPGSERAVEQGLAFLARLQLADGRWSLNDFGQAHNNQPDAVRGSIEADTAATGLALLSYLGAGYTHRDGKYRPAIDAGLKWLTSRQKADGDLFTGGSSFAWLYSHGIATIALCEAYGMTRDPALREPAQRAVDFIVAAQHRTLGGWRYVPRQESDTSVSGWQMMALKSGELAGLRVPAATYGGVAKWLNIAGQKSDVQAQYAYMPASTLAHQRDTSRAMTAEALLMRLYLGWPRDDARVRLGVDYLEEDLPRYEPRVRDAYYWYYATQVMFQVGGESWETWNGALRELLVARQTSAGPWAGSWHPTRPAADRWGAQAGRLYVTTMHLLMLEVYYRHLPLYQTLQR